MKLMAKCIKFINKSNRDEIMGYTIEIANSKTYYTRRLFYPFFETILTQYSSNFIIENNLLQTVMKFMEDNNHSLYTFLKILPKIYFMIYNDLIVKNKLENRLKALKHESKDKEILNVIRIIIKEVKKFQLFMTNYQDKFIYSTSYLEFSLNDRLKNDSELAIFNKDTKLVQQSNSSSQIVSITYYRLILENQCSKL
jgi:hypothetical protein